MVGKIKIKRKIMSTYRNHLCNHTTFSFSFSFSSASSRKQKSIVKLEDVGKYPLVDFANKWFQHPKRSGSIFGKRVADITERISFSPVLFFHRLFTSFTKPFFFFFAVIAFDE